MSCHSAINPRRCGGFTLIEVLVALAIVAVTLGAGIRASGALAQNTERVALVSMAQWCAENQLVALRLSREFPGVGDVNFSCDQLGITLQGKRSVRPTPNPNFRRVDAQVLDANEQPLLTLSTVVPRFYQ
jgi:general secretion pathway protein I